MNDKQLNASILLVEDEPGVVTSVIKEIEDLGCRCEHLVDGKEGLDRALEKDFDLVILDLGLPSLGGLEICRILRKEKKTQPILILTGKSDETSTVLALELGADEYITKPFRSMEFRSRVRALLRRVQAMGESAANSQNEAESGGKLVFKDLVLDLNKKQVHCEQTIINITPIEFEILVLLIQNPDKTFTRDEILSIVWGCELAGYENNVRTHFSRLRKKLLEVGKSGPYIVTARGFGYRLASEDDVDDK